MMRDERLQVVRRVPLDRAISFHYSTVNGTAKKNLHYLPKRETPRFEPGESFRDITIQLVDDADWRLNYVFYVHLKVQDDAGEKSQQTKLGTNVTRVRLSDETNSLLGEDAIEFVASDYVSRLPCTDFMSQVVKESAGSVRLFVTRNGKRAAKTFTVKYETVGTMRVDCKSHLGG